MQQIAAQCFLYSPKDRLGNRQMEMERRLADLEGLMNRVWPVLAEGFVDFHADESMRKGLAPFVSILHLRHPKRLTETEALHAQMVAAYNTLPKDAAGRPLIKSFEYGGIERPFDASGWHDYNAAGPEKKKQMFVDGIRQNATYGAEILTKKRWLVIFSQEPVFITTDIPITIVNQHREVFGIGTPGTRIFFPLSPTRLLMIDGREDEPDGLYYPLLDDKRGGAPFNLAAWSRADRFMISPRHTDQVCAEMLAWSEENPA